MVKTVLRLRTAHTGELAVHQIGARLALQYRVTPVADVLEDQRAQDYFGRSSQPAALPITGEVLRGSLLELGQTLRAA